MRQFKQHFKPIVLSLLIIPLLFLTACGSNNGNGNSGGGESTGNNNNGGASYSGTITFADAQFDSIEIHNWVARTILEKGYGLKTAVQSGSAATTILGLQRGDIQAYMEIWTISQQEPYKKALDSGNVKELSVNYADDEQGLYIPEYMIKGDPDRDIEPITPDLKSVKQLPKYWKLFKDPRNPSKGRIIGAPSAYEADKTLQKQMDAFKLNDTYNYFTPGSEAALVTSLKKAYKAGKPWVGYGWTPTWFAAKYDLVLLKEPKHTQKCWDTDRACAFPKDKVAVAVNSKFAKKAPKVVDFLSHYHTSAEITNKMLLHMQEKDASKEETAKWWLKNNDLWTKWVPDGVAKKVKDSL